LEIDKANGKDEAEEIVYRYNEPERRYELAKKIKEKAGGK
jgi:hypothetical protein